MRVLLLVPRVHFYAPLVLREVFENHEGLDFRVLMTPKIDSRNSFLGGVGSLIRDQGLRYLASQAGLRCLYGALGRLKHLLGHTATERREIEVIDVIDHFGVASTTVRNVQSDRTMKIVRDWSPDYLISLFFNQILPEELLLVPHEDALNLHPGTLPQYRGTSPVFWQLFNRESRAGCALHRLTPEIDAGPIYDQGRIRVRDFETYYSLYSRLAESGAKLVSDFLTTIRGNGNYHLDPQDEAVARSYSQFDRSDVQRFYARCRGFWSVRDFHDGAE